jgi:hypothetical protein
MSEKFVQEGTLGFRSGTPIIEHVEIDPDLGPLQMGKSAIPYELKGKRVRVTIEVLGDES